MPPTPPPSRLGLRAKLIRAMLSTLAVVSALTLVTVGYINYRSARRTFETIETQLQQSITRKGHGLAANQALALRGLVADNAFGDVERLVEQSVRADDEMVYGLFVGADGKPWAYVSPTHNETAAAGEGWEQLGIQPELAAKPGHAQARRVVFDQRIFEFSAAVTSDEDVVLGRIYYGISGVPLERALEQARSDFRQSLIVALLLLAAVGLTGTLLGLGIIRKLSARITRPLAHLTEVATAIAAGNRDERVKVGTDDELGVLGRAFNQMMQELRDSYQRLETLNHTLEVRVEERTRELAQRNRDMRLVLDNVDRGFLTMSMDGVLSHERSAIVDQWFGGYDGHVRFGDYIAKQDRNFADAFDVGFEALREEILPLELYVDQLPKRLKVGEREFAFAYRPILDGGGATSGLLIVVNDVTVELLHAQQEEERGELLAMVQSYSRDRAGVLGFFDDAERIIRVVREGLDAEARKRLIHTLKGNAALAGFNVIAGLCHQIEDELAEQDEAAFVVTAERLAHRWAVISEMRSTLLGERAQDIVEIPTAKLEEIIQQLTSVGAGSALVGQILAWKLEPAERPLTRLGAYARSLAKRLGKGDVHVQIDAEGASIDPKRWAPFWSEMVHVIRNAVDHGLETPPERRAAGKSTPQLILRADTGGGCLTVEVEDDGHGIDWNRVRTVARARGLPAETQEDLTAALFVADVSTRSVTSTTSGRGMGLAAVKERVLALGGRISVSSAWGSGTRFTFQFPIEATSGSTAWRSSPSIRPPLSGPV
jgi:two-component system, chemotaxis family, sensor kinase CheA